MIIPKILTNKVNRLIVKIPVGIVAKHTKAITIIPILNCLSTVFRSLTVKGLGI